MPIDARCPFCDKAYRLKDDLVGKKVTCANSDCRKVFPVVALATASADDIAAAALAEEAQNAEPAESRTIAMACVICDHKWIEPWDRQGKNVLCPDCKHRQKVPEQKPAQGDDWRRGSGKPSLAKQETLENVTSARETKMVSGETLLKTGVIDDGVEPRSLKSKVLIGLMILLPFVILGSGIAYWRMSSRNKGTEKVVDDFVKAADADEFKDLPLHRALLRMAGGEFAARQATAESLPLAVERFNSSLANLDGAGTRAADRDCLTGELALVMLKLGGSGEAVTDGLKIPWVPAAPKGSRAQIQNNRAMEEGVQGQLRRVFQSLQRNQADFDLRAWIARRLARELIRHNQIEVLRSNLSHGFTEAELPEMEAQIGLELLRSGDVETAKGIAQGLASQLSAGIPPGPLPVSAPALWLACEIKGPSLVPEPSASMGDATRMTYTSFNLAKKDAAAALEIANRAGPAEARLRALALGAEWAEQPAPFLDAAEKVVNDFLAKPDPNAALSSYPLVRLAAIAGQTGDLTRAAGFAKGINDIPLKTYAIADAYRQSLAADPSKVVNEADAPLPADPANAKDLLLGHAWARYHLARRAGYSGSAETARNYLNTWPKPLVAPFGAAGAILGVQDKQVAP